ncbi:MAG: hypothetical protein SFU91_14785 [Chloroherpetonaceae bacterium]|nr:hypothetical protein [Chloroherpetonaceae bacterium]
MPKPKEELLQTLSRYKSDRIRGVLLQVYFDPDFLPNEGFDDELESLGRELLDQSGSPFLASLECEVGLSRFETVYLVHIWSEEFHEKNLPAGDLSDMQKWHQESELEELCRFMKSLSDVILSLPIKGLHLVPEPKD